MILGEKHQVINWELAEIERGIQPTGDKTPIEVPMGNDDNVPAAGAILNPGLVPLAYLI
jgi:hypothetical protein